MATHEPGPSPPGPAPPVPVTPEESHDTRTRLLDTAERLFAEHGISATSLRQITAEAGANLAAVNYHFGSKAALIEEVYARRIRPLNDERLRRLRAAEEAAGAGPPSLESILEAFLAPVERMCVDPHLGGPAFIQLMARANMEPTEEIHALVYRQFTETGMEFYRVLRAALPHLAPHEIFVRFRFTLGAMFFTFAHVLDPLKIGAPAELEPKSDRAMAEDLVRFVAAGFRAPTSEADTT